MKLERVNVNSIKPHPKNPRIHPESQLEKLQASIEQFGWTNPILLSKDGYILAGHGRYEVAKRMGMAEIPVIRLELDGATAEGYMLADNRIQQETFWDMALLRELMDGLQETDYLLATGFEEEEIDDLLTIYDEEFKRPAPEEILGGQQIPEFPAKPEPFEPTRTITPSEPQYEPEEEHEEEHDEETEYEAPTETPRAAAPLEPVGGTGTWEEKKGAYPTGNWLAIEFYGDDFRFNQLFEKLDELGLMVTQHEIDPDFFYQLIMKDGEGIEI